MWVLFDFFRKALLKHIERRTAYAEGVSEGLVYIRLIDADLDAQFLEARCFLVGAVGF